MRTSLLLTCLLLPSALAAQSSSTFYAGLGATWSSKLVEDNIVSDKITTQPGIAPTIMVGGATEVFPPDDADCIVDNTASGSTLRANNLQIVDELMQSSTRRIQL